MLYFCDRRNDKKRKVDNSSCCSQTASIFYSSLCFCGATTISTSIVPTPKSCSSTTNTAPTSIHGSLLSTASNFSTSTTTTSPSHTIPHFSHISTNFIISIKSDKMNRK